MTRTASRPALVLLGLGVLGAAGFWLAAGSAAMPSWFAAWLFWIGLPMGALPLVMLAEASGMLRMPLLPVLRAMLPLLPLGTLFALPLLGGLGGLFARPGLPGALPDWWTAPAAAALRDGGVLIVLSLLALVFWVQPRRARRALAWPGLLLVLVLATVLSVDVVLAPEPALGSSLAGVLLIAGQVTLAAALSGLVVAVGTAPDRRLPRSVGTVIGLLVAFWLFVQFGQFLVVWSANLPIEAAWYLARLGEVGTPVIAFAALAALAATILLPSLLGRIPVAVATLASTMAIALAAVTLLFVLPAYRGRFVLTLPDLLATVGLGGLLVGTLLLLIPSEARHDPA